MRFPKYLVSIIAVLVLFNFLAAGDFEGKVTQSAVYVSLYDVQEVTSMSQAEELFAMSQEQLKQLAMESGDDEAYSKENIEIYIKGNKFRMNTQQEGKAISVIYDTESDKMITLQHDQKMAMVTGMGKMMEMGKQMGEAMPGMMGREMEEKKGGDQFSMEATGETKTINGFKCKLYKGTASDGDFTHMWIHNAYVDVMESLVKTFGKMEKSEQAGMQEEEKFFKEVQGVPILTKSASVEDLNINEIKEISEQSVPDDMFQIPDGYQTMNMQNMMQQQMKKLQDMMKQQQE